MHVRWRGGLVAVALAAAWTCSGLTTSPSATGTWGGAHVRATVTETASHLEFDCAHADIPSAFTLDSRSAFDLRGTFVREHGGPIRSDEKPDSHPAAFRGSVARTRMTLTIQLTDTSEVIGTFTLVHGSVGEVVKCL